ncbi:hypothetical protein Tco_0213576, partial [Tanacetum coccineum]
GDNEEEEVQEVQRPMSRDRAKKKEAASMASSASGNEDLLASYVEHLGINMFWFCPVLLDSARYCLVLHLILLGYASHTAWFCLPESLNLLYFPKYALSASVFLNLIYLNLSA